MRWFGGVAALAMMVGAAAEAQTVSDDPHIWLEEVGGARALTWVEAENQKTATSLQADPRYQRFYDDALAVLQASDRIPNVTFRGSGLYNFWQDADHVKGIIRRTSLDSYRTPTPVWETVFDVDAIAKAEGKSWVYKGMTCLQPDERRCLVSLSDGGRDAVVVREYDLVDRRFVEGGFVLPEGRNFASWIDADTLLVSRDWGPGTMTPSNYPIIVKSMRRGEPLSAARELFRGRADDVGTFPNIVRDTQGAVQAIAATRSVTTFTSKTSLIRDGGPLELNLPSKASVMGAVAGRVLVSLDEAWKRADGTTFPAGSIVAMDLDAWKANPNRAPASLVWAAGPGQSLDGASVTAGRLIISYLDNVRGRAAVLTPQGKGWRTEALDLPANATLALGSSDNRGERAFVTVTDFLTPSSLYLVDSAAGRVEPLKTSPARFDASRHIIEQHAAESRDGTRIPYFVVRPKDKPLDGSLPTLLNGYGGFQSSQLPGYSGALGKLWLEGGNGYVVANIRGGGEFGPAWHEAAIGANKQKTWDDYIAVAEDLVRRKISSPRRLGVVGGSQGGLLVGTAITQRPDLFRAAIIQVPLFDMLRYHLIGNGASWTGEYGDPTKPAERPWVAAYSPYQRLSKAQASIVPFIETSAADDRVTPVHGRKAAARLAELGVPYYYYENREGGHAAAANQPEKARLLALEYVYAAQRLVD